MDEQAPYRSADAKVSALATNAGQVDPYPCCAGIGSRSFGWHFGLGFILRKARLCVDAFAADRLRLTERHDVR